MALPQDERWGSGPSMPAGPSLAIESDGDTDDLSRRHDDLLVVGLIPGSDEVDGVPPRSHGDGSGLEARQSSIEVEDRVGRIHPEPDGRRLRLDWSFLFESRMAGCRGARSAWGRGFRRRGGAARGRSTARGGKDGRKKGAYRLAGPSSKVEG